MTIKEYNQSVDDYSDSLFRFFLKNISERAVAEDLVQETFTKVWTKLRDVEYEKVKSYLFTVGYRTMIDYVRSLKRERNYKDNYTSEEALLPDYDLKEVLQVALEKLPEIQRSVILLRDYEGYSYEEIQEITGLNESQVKVYIFRARKSMKELLLKNKQIFPAY